MRSSFAPLRAIARTSLAAACMLTLAATAAAQNWIDLATVSSTLGNTAGRLCVGAGRTDLGCPATAPYLDTATGNLTMGGLLSVPQISATTGVFYGDLTVRGNFYVSGSQTIEGVTFANGGVSATGTITATSFVGDGSGLTGVVASNVDWYNIARIPAQVQAVSNGTAISLTSVSVTTASINGLGVNTVNAGTVSTTGQVSVAGLFSSADVTVTGTVSATNFTGNFIGNGASLTNIPASAVTGLNLDRITSGTSAIIVNSASGVISLTQLGSAAAYLHPTLGYVGPGVSATGPISGTNGYFSGSTRIDGNLTMSNRGQLTTGIVSSDIMVAGSGNIMLRPLNDARGVAVGPASAFTPSSTLHVAGSIRLASESNATFGTCDANRTGAIRYAGGDFAVCRNGSTWETLTSIAQGAAGLADRISSGTTQLVVTSNTGFVSLTQAGTNTGWFDPARGLVTLGVSATGPISGTAGYFNTSVGIGAPPSSNALEIQNTGGSLIRLNRTGVLADGWIHRMGSAGTGGASGYYLSPLGTAFRDFWISGYGSNEPMFVVRTSTSDVFVPLGKLSVGISTTNGATPSASLHVSGSVRLAKDNGALDICDTNRAGAIKYEGGDFAVCRNGSTWETLTSIAQGAAGLADRITSGTTTFVVTSATGFVSLTQAGTNTGWFDPARGLVTLGVSATGGISGSAGYFTNTLNIGTSTAEAKVTIQQANENILGLLVKNTSYSTAGFDGFGVQVTNAGNTILRGGWNTSRSLILNDNGGNVGIGTAAPETLLHIQGTGFAKFYETGALGLYRPISNNATILGITSDISGTGSSVFRVAGDGTVGINLRNTTFTNNSVTLHVGGSLRLAAEVTPTLQTCDTNRTGAIKFESGNFFVCRNGTTWETLVAGATGTADTDRITSGTTGVLVNSATTYISLSTGGSGWGYLSSGTSYLPRLHTIHASTTTISTTAVQIFSPTTPLACNTSTAGTLRYNSPTTTLELCTGTGWQPMGVGVPAGTISAFASTTCPVGWSEYTPARGRFLRGIDNGAGNDPDGTRAPGNTQADLLKAHSHGYSAWYGAVYGDGSGGLGGGASVNYGPSNNTTSAGGAETRPKNVAVTYCQFNGTSNGWNNPISGTSVTPGGGTGAVQFNSAGAFEGSANLDWNNAGNILSVTGLISTTSITVGGQTIQQLITSNASTDRITSGTTSVITNSPVETISFTTAGVRTMTVTSQSIYTSVSMFTGVNPDNGLSMGLGYVGVRPGNAAQAGYTAYYTSSSTRIGYVGWGSAATGMRINTAAGVPLAFYTSDTEAMRIMPNGRVGIGTTSPTANLNIFNAATTSLDLSIDGAANGNQTGLNLVTHNGSVASVGNAATKGWHLSARGNGWTAAGSNPNDLILVGYDGISPRRVLTANLSTGYLGVGGLITPTTTLEVSGTVSATVLQTAATTLPSTDCDGAEDYGKFSLDPTSKQPRICLPR